MFKEATWTKIGRSPVNRFAIEKAELRRFANATYDFMNCSYFEGYSYLPVLKGVLLNVWYRWNSRPARRCR